MKNKIKLSKEKREEMIKSIKNYFYEEKDEEIGDLAATLFLDFIIEEFASEFYNQGIYDSHSFMNDKLDDLLGLQKY